jgi:hypothetical protein
MVAQPVSGGRHTRPAAQRAAAAGRVGPPVGTATPASRAVVLRLLVVVAHAPEHPHQEDHQQPDIDYADADLEDPPRGGHRARW